MTLPSVSTTSSGSDNIMDFSNESNRFGWSKQIEREPSPSLTIERVPSGRVQNSSTSNEYLDNFKGQIGGRGDIIEDYLESSEQTFEQNKVFSMMSEKAKTYQPSSLEDKMRKAGTETNPRDLLKFGANNSHSNDNLNALLKVIELLNILHWVPFYDQANHPFKTRCSFFRKRMILLMLIADLWRRLWILLERLVIICIGLF